MSKINREEWKGMTLKNIKEQDDEIRNGSSKEPKIEPGTNKIRFFPAHPGTAERDSYYQKLVVSWLPYIREKDGEEIKSRRPIKNARHHGAQERDVVEEYIRIATETILSDTQLSVKERGALLDVMTAWETRISPKTTFLSYAKKKEGDKWIRGPIEYKISVLKELDDASLVDYEDNPDGVDIVSDIKEGCIINIKYNPKANVNDKYKVSVPTNSAHVLTDDDLAWLKEQKPLTELLFSEGVYHQGEFDKAMSGLKMYDKEHNLGIFEEEEFQEIAAELRAMLTEAPGGSKESRKEEGDKDFEDMNRNELKQWIMDNDLAIRVRRGMTKDDLLDAILEAEKTGGAEKAPF
ncbi:MAG: hypothetical protein AAF620_00190 [Bacteroidota bacterium]